MSLQLDKCTQSYLQISNHLLSKRIIWMDLKTETQRVRHNSSKVHNCILMQIKNKKISVLDTKCQKTCSYKKNTAVENVFDAQLTMARLESGSRYIKTHSAIINVGRLIMISGIKYVNHQSISLLAYIFNPGRRRELRVQKIYNYSV